MSEAKRRGAASRDQGACAETKAREPREEPSLRTALLAEIVKLTESAMRALSMGNHPAWETVDVTGLGSRAHHGIRLAKTWMEDRGSAIVAIDFLLDDGTFAAGYDNRVAHRIDNWDAMSESRLRGIRDGLRRLASTTA